MYFGGAGYLGIKPIRYRKILILVPSARLFLVLVLFFYISEVLSFFLDLINRLRKPFFLYAILANKLSVLIGMLLRSLYRVYAQCLIVYGVMVTPR